MELEKEYALIGATVIDGNGGPPASDTTVVVKNGVIEEVGDRESIKLKEGIQKVDISGYYLMPGLIDVHVHFTGLRRGDFASIEWLFESNLTQAMRTTVEAEKVLDAGFTTVRSCGSRYDISLRQLIQEGTIIGPRLITAGLCIASRGGHGDIRGDKYEMPEGLTNMTDPMGVYCNGADEIRKFVRILCNQNVDLIKVIASGGGEGPTDRLDDVAFSREELQVLVDEAHMHHKRVAAHSECIETTRMVVELGVNTIEHGGCPRGKIGLDEDVCEAMVEKDIILVPTLAINYCGGPWDTAKTTAAGAIIDEILNGFMLAIKRGVKIAAGSDAFADNITPYGKHNIGEIKLLVDILGFTPLEAITSATKIGAEACGIGDKIGTIEKGKLADLLVFKNDPTSNIDVLLKKEDIKYIIKDGSLAIEH